MALLYVDVRGAKKYWSLLDRKSPYLSLQQAFSTPVRQAIPISN